MSTIKNPYANPDGTAKFNLLPEFLAWERENELKRRALLPKRERIKLEESDRNLEKKMNS